MDEKVLQIENLKKQIADLQEENQYLKDLLNRAGIGFHEIKALEEASLDSAQKIKHELITRQHALLLFSYFKGRKDVYSKRYVRKDGKSGYATACDNFWKYNICPKRSRQKMKCPECENRQWTPITQSVLLEHLEGKSENGSDVIGVYPLLQNDTCNFLVFDFDDHDAGDLAEDSNTVWQEDVDALRQICKMNGVDTLVERSRSGKGAHVWIFFAEEIKAELARKFGSALLTKGSESVNQKNFKTYDRMLPAQDHIPEGGVGNLIALPLQGKALIDENSAFVDESWNAYYDQWEILRNAKKISKEFVEEKIKEWSPHGVLGILADNGEDDAKPWEKKQIKLNADDVEGEISIVEANQLFITTGNLKPRLQNRLRRLAAFSNPQYYKKSAMGYSTSGIPRIICCAEEYEGYIGLPRGCKEKLISLLEVSGIQYHFADERQCGRAINVTFTGALYLEQQAAVDTMLNYENGILGATTAFGKTVAGAYLVASKKVNTLILVHNREIMKNWIEDFQRFLEIDEALPKYFTKTGREKTRKSVIGKMYAGHDSTTGIIDVVMISSLGKNGDINQKVKDYGMVIMDECHHAGAKTYEDVLKEINAKYVYGLTATPKRDDGQEKKVYMQFGPIRYRYTAKDRALKQGIGHYVYPRFTRLVNLSNKEWTINEAYKEAVEDESRNNMIIEDALACIDMGRTPLILTKFKEHARILYEALVGHVDSIFLLQGGRSTRERDEIREKMKVVPENQSLILIAIGKYIGEGFNYPRLDTMLLAMPISWEGNVEQYAGRLHRDHDQKKDTIIYDYIDIHIRKLEKMYHKRLTAYKKIGYEICGEEIKEKQTANAIFDSDTYRGIYCQDLRDAQKEIIISSPGLSRQKVDEAEQLFHEPMLRGVQIIVLTLTPDAYKDRGKDGASDRIRKLEQYGVSVKTMDVMHEHFAIIDKEIVWYGSMNLLSNEKPEDNLIRVADKEIAQELMELGYNQYREENKEA